MTRPYKRGPSCSHCDQPRAHGRAYCPKHWAEYQRRWRAMQTRELRRLRKMIHGVSRETMESGRK